MSCMPVGVVAEIEQSYTEARLVRLRHYITMARQLMDHHRSYGVACMTLEQAIDAMVEDVNEAAIKADLLHAYDGPDKDDDESETITSIAAFALVEVLAWERGEGHRIESCPCQLRFICGHSGPSS